jgi:UMF1 family MFS transporter
MWYLYDYANSLALIAVMYYFGLWVVNDLGGSQWLVSLSVSTSTLILIAVVPKLGRLADLENKQPAFMYLFSLGAIASLFAMAALPKGAALWSIVVLYVSFNFFFQTGYVFFSSLLRRISSDANRDKISGIGQAWGQIGNLSGILLGFAVIKSETLGISGKQHVFLWAAFAFLILLSLIWRLGKFEKLTVEPLSEPAITLSSHTIFRKLKQQPRIGAYLFAYFLYADAMMTISYFITLFMQKAPQLSDGQMKTAAIMILLGTILGGALIPILIRFWATFSLIKTSLFAWSLTLLSVALTSQYLLLLALLFLVGIFQSIIFALSRGYYASLTPRNEQAEYFSIYVIFERLGGIVGPLLWSTVIFAFSSLGEASAYKIAMISLAVITAFGGILFSRQAKSHLTEGHQPLAY